MVEIWPLSGGSDKWDDGLAGALLTADYFTQPAPSTGAWAVNVSGAWKNLAAVSVKVAGAWKAVGAAYVRVSGQWVQVHG